MTNKQTTYLAAFSSSVMVVVAALSLAAGIGPLLAIGVADGGVLVYARLEASLRRCWIADPAGIGFGLGISGYRRTLHKQGINPCCQ